MDALGCRRASEVILYLDTETRSPTPIAHGTHRYAETCEIIMTQYAIDDGPVIVTDGLDPLLQDLVDTADTVVTCAKNGFDRLVAFHHGVVIPTEKMEDVAIQALSHGLPASLDKLCQIFRLPVDLQKDKRGKQLIQIFCKPRKDGGWNDKTTHPIEWQQFREYGGSDILSMRELYKRIPRINYPSPREHAVWRLTERINDRGMKIDLDLARGAIDTVAAAKKIMDKRTEEMTDGELSSTTKRDQLLRLVLSEYGVTLPDMQKGTLERRMEDPDLPDGARELLAMRLQTSTTSNAKYNTLIRSTSDDGRLRGTLQFVGAPRTKRWSGLLFQPTNLPRPDLPADEIDLGIGAIKAGAAHLLWDEPIKLCSNAIRGSIVADEGKKLVIADLAQVEARVLPWLAGEQWKLDAFAAYDRGEAPDNYVMAYSKGFGVAPADVDKAGRQIGKVSELSCLGPHTRVLTSNGVKPITEVTTADKLWDGIEWVTHQGLVFQGVKRVINLSGMVVTPDHLIFAANDWREARTVASSPNTLRSALAIASASLPSSTSPSERVAGCTSSGWRAHAEQSRISSSLTTSAKGRALAAMSALKKQQATTQKSTTDMSTSALTTDTAAACSAASQPVSRDASRTGIPIMARVASGFTSRGEKGQLAAERSSSIWSGLKAGISRISNWIARTPTEITPQAISALSPRNTTSKPAARSGSYRPGSMSLSSVFDIALAGPRNRFTVLTDDGPLIVHNCGYGGAYAAWAAMGALYGFELPKSQVDPIVRAWRQAHPAICDWDTGLWAQLDHAARMAIMHPGQQFAAGEFIMFERWREWLRMRLPSGTFLNYAAPAIIDDPRRPGKDTVSYLGVNNYSRKWERLTTYGGKLSADATQGTAREIMAENLPWIEENDYLPVLLVHDEVVTETPDSPEYASGRLSRMLALQPRWAPGLPLAAAGFETYRYRKD